MKNKINEINNNLKLLKKEKEKIDNEISFNEKRYEYLNFTISETNDYLINNFNKKINKISDYISSKLEKYFNLKFKIDLDITNNSLQALVLVSENGSNFHSILDYNGGGVSDFISTILRIIFLEKSKNLKILILDEPFKNISSEYKEIMSSILEEIVSNLDIQILMITHDQFFTSISNKIFVINKIPENIKESIDDDNIVIIRT